MPFRGPSIVAALVSLALLTGVLVGVAQRPASAEVTAVPGDDVTSVTGSAFGNYSSVTFFGGAPLVFEPIPSVTLPSTGGSETASVESVVNQQGPATLFESGPITVTTEGATGSGGYAASSVSIIQDKAGVDPFYFSTVNASCTSSATGTSGTTTLTGAGVYQGNGESVTLPDDPAPNSEYFGTIDNVGDNFRMVVNEQVLTSDSITVNAMHLYLLGPTARGELIVGQSRCAVAATSPNSSVPVGVDDAYSTDSYFLYVAGPGLLANDTEADGETLTAQVQSQPGNGVVKVYSDGSFTYTPNTGFSGTDTFTYLVRDPRGASDIATVTVDATAPPLVVGNDNFVDAAPISGLSGGVGGTTEGATTEPGEYSHANQAGGSIWYSFTVPEDALVTMDTCIRVEERFAGFAVYVGDSVDTLVPRADSSTDYFGQPDPQPDDYNCRAVFRATAGTVYHVGVVSQIPGPIVLNWTSVPAPGPANDDFADAQVISGPSGSVTGSNLYAGEEPGEPAHAARVYTGSEAMSVWYDWTAPADGEVTFNTCQSRDANPENYNGGWLDTILAVYTGESVDALTEVVSNDEDEAELCGGGAGRFNPGGSRVSFTATAGTVYHIAVDAKATGTIVLDWTTTTGNEPVAVDDLLVITGTSGSVDVLANDSDPNGDTLTVTGHTDAFGFTIECAPAGLCTVTAPDDYAIYKFTASFLYTVTDSNGESSVGTVNIRFNLPTAVDDTYSTPAGTALTVDAPGVLANDSDALGDPLTAGSASDPAGGSVTVNPDGSFTYTPDTGFTGTDTFTYIASDPGGRPSLPATVTVTVTTPVVGPPTDAGACRNNGWKTFNNPVFRSQGACASYVKANPRGSR